MKNKFIYTVILCFFTLSITAQNTAPKALEGLHLAGPNELNPGTPLMLNPTEMPIYNENFERLTEQAFQQMMMSMEYLPEPYLDNASNVKAMVLRKATPEELKMMQQMQGKGGPDMSGPTEIKASPLLNQAAPHTWCVIHPLFSRNIYIGNAIPIIQLRTCNITVASDFNDVAWTTSNPLDHRVVRVNPW